MALTIRLNEKETKELAKLQDYFETKTASGAIKRLIKDHMTILANLNDTNCELMEKIGTLKKLTDMIHSLTYHQIEQKGIMQDLDYFAQMGEFMKDDPNRHGLLE